MLRSLLLLCVLGSSASAESRLGVHVGGGLEGGPITGVPRPDGVAEAGFTAELLVPGRAWGFGFTAEAVNRLSLEAREEVKLDGSFRWAGRNGRIRAGVGAGMRIMAFARDGVEQALYGVDMIRIDMNAALARWPIAGLPRAMTVSVDAYWSWTLGCYRGELVMSPSGDMVAQTRRIGCGDSLTTTYVLGLGTSIRWR